MEIERINVAEPKQFILRVTRSELLEIKLALSGLDWDTDLWETIHNVLEPPR